MNFMIISIFFIFLLTSSQACTIHQSPCYADMAGFTDAGAYDGANAKTLVECKALCLANPACNSFAVDQVSANKCYLKGNTLTGTEPCAAASSWNFITYYKRCPTPAPVTQAPVTQAPVTLNYCIKITTGAGAFNNGFIKVLINSQVAVAQQFFQQGSIVLNQCYASLPQVGITSSSFDAWAGTFEYSQDGGSTYDQMICEGCVAGSGPDSNIAVESDNNFGPNAANGCINGNTCLIVPATCILQRSPCYADMTGFTNEGDYDGANGKTLVECKALCLANPACNSFAVDQLSANKCYLKGNTLTGTEPCAAASSWNFITYYKQCPTPAPVTQAPVTQAPVTQAPVTQAPVTQAPVTQAPVTQAPVTQAPVTQAPVTQAPVTQAPVTQAQPNCVVHSVGACNDGLPTWFNTNVNVANKEACASHCLAIGAGALTGAGSTSSQPVTHMAFCASGPCGSTNNCACYNSCTHVNGANTLRNYKSYAIPCAQEVAAKTNTGPCVLNSDNNAYARGSAELATGYRWNYQSNKYGSYTTVDTWTKCLDACQKTTGCVAFAYGVAIRNCFPYKAAHTDCTTAGSWRPHYDFFKIPDATALSTGTVPATPAGNRGTASSPRYQVVAQGTCKSHANDFPTGRAIGYTWSSNAHGTYTRNAQTAAECYVACLNTVGCKSFSSMDLTYVNAACFLYNTMECVGNTASAAGSYDRYVIGQKFWRAEYGLSCSDLGGQPITSKDECMQAEAETRGAGRARLNVYAIENTVAKSSCFVDKKILYFNPSGTDKTINYNEFDTQKSANVCKGNKKLYVNNENLTTMTFSLQGASYISAGCAGLTASIQAAMENQMKPGLFCGNTGGSGLCGLPYRTKPTVSVSPGSGCVRRRLLDESEMRRELEQTTDAPVSSFDVKLVFRSAEKMSTANLKVIQDSYKSAEMKVSLQAATGHEFKPVTAINTREENVSKTTPVLKKVEEIAVPTTRTPDASIDDRKASFASMSLLALFSVLLMSM